MDTKKLEAYANLIVKTGINPVPGQEILVLAGLDQPDFVRMVVEKCYQAGAGRVVVTWDDMPLAKLDQIYRSEESLSELADWELAKWKWRADSLPALLWLDSDDPDGMNGIDQGKRARAQAARYPKIKPFRDAMENKHQWCIAGVPGVNWARKVFPGLPDAEAVEKLWDAILKAARAVGDPIANWEEHNKTVHARADKLNSFHFKALEYKASNGTDFRVGLIPEGIFAGGSETDLSGRVFNPNIPSEEIFTSPKKGEAEGLLVSSKPLSWQGSLIENFSIRFENGKAVEVHAEKGQDALEKMISMDETAGYLGECALIDYKSPISDMGILFYNTLYDENASCHVALGRGFENCIANYEKYTREELQKMGINDSMIHVDFMIGTEDLDITGITENGERVPVFRNGSWCF
ncbi:MAG: aminopeptidase [Lentisphaeria bacterium]|nr:aminopeptidase [Lentisphaeria bacterium]